MTSYIELSPDHLLSPTGWLMALLATFVVGLAKGGIKGIGVISIIILAIVYGGRPSTGILLPLLIIGDLFAVWYFHQHAQWKYLKRLLPWMVVGVLIGVWTGKDLPEDTFKKWMGVIILLSVVAMLWLERRNRRQVPDNHFFAGLMGLGSGFTTMIGNLAGAFSNIFFLAIRLPKDQFIGTAAWLFLLINIFKLPFHILVWQTVTPETIALNIRLLPALLAGLLAGIHMVSKIREQQYRILVMLLTAMGALIIFFR